MSRPNYNRKYKIVGTLIKVKGRTVGQVIGDVFTKDIHSMMDNPPAIASDIQALHDAEAAGARYCVFTNTVNGIIYQAPIEKFWSIGRKVNLGWGDQQMLTLPNWTQTRDPEYSYMDTETFSESTTSSYEVKPLNIKSRAPKGVTFTKGKQLTLWGRK